MQILPDNITNLIEEFSKLPSIGPKSAERLVFYLLSSGDNEQFGEAMINLKKGLTRCELCKTTPPDKPVRFALALAATVILSL
jgi:recombination protein RecR